MQQASSTLRVNLVKAIAIEAPVAVAVDADGRIHVAREDDTVGVITGDGAFHIFPSNTFRIFP